MRCCAILQDLVLARFVPQRFYTHTISYDVTRVRYFAITMFRDYDVSRYFSCAIVLDAFFDASGAELKQGRVRGTPGVSCTLCATEFQQIPLLKANFEYFQLQTKGQGSFQRLCEAEFQQIPLLKADFEYFQLQTKGQGSFQRLCDAEFQQIPLLKANFEYFQLQTKGQGSFRRLWTQNSIKSSF